jgi:hypothetical protein
MVLYNDFILWFYKTVLHNVSAISSGQQGLQFQVGNISRDQLLRVIAHQDVHAEELVGRKARHVVFPMP